MPAILFFLNSMGLGVGLAMDAFTVSIADGLSEQDGKTDNFDLLVGPADKTTYDGSSK